MLKHKENKKTPNLLCLMSLQRVRFLRGRPQKPEGGVGFWPWLFIVSWGDKELGRCRVGCASVGEMPGLWECRRGASS